MALVVRKGRSNRDVSFGADIEDVNIEHPLLELCLTSSKGLGLFASQDIERGTCILSEAPLLVIANLDSKTPLCLWQRLETVSPSELRQFDSLHCNKELVEGKKCSWIRNSIIASGKLRQGPQLLNGFVEMEKHRCGIFQTNATTVDPNNTRAIFLLYSRINHSCTPNVYATYNHSLGLHTVHATRDIKEGEELLTAYIDCAQPVETRNEALKERGVDCGCAVCDQIDAAFSRSETNRSRLRNLARGLGVYDGKLDHRDRVPAHLIPRNPREALAAAEERILLLKEEELLGMQVASAYRLASRYCLQLGMVEKAKAYAKKEGEVERDCVGGETASSAEGWMKQIEVLAEKEKVKIRMCEKRGVKEVKRAEKKAEKKMKKDGGGRR